MIAVVLIDFVCAVAMLAATGALVRDRRMFLVRRHRAAVMTFLAVGWAVFAAALAWEIFR